MQPKSHRDLLRVDAKPAASYGRFALVRLTAYSVHWLTQWDIPTTYENVSVLNARLFPTKFCLAGFPEMPDAMATNRAILQMRPKYRGFATSDPHKGVFLTDKGRQEAGKVLESVGPPTLDKGTVEVPLEDRELGSEPMGDRTRDPRRIVADARAKLLYRRHKAGQFDETDVVHLLGLLSMYDHTPPSELRAELCRLREDAQSICDEEFVAFLDAVSVRFSTYLHRPDPKKKSANHGA